MDISKLKEIYMKKEKPIIIHSLESFKSKKTAATDFEHSFSTNDEISVPINNFEAEYHESFKEIRKKGLKKLKSKFQKNSLNLAHFESETLTWMKKIEIIEQSTKGCLWVLKDDVPICVSGSEAEKDEMYITPRFITAPDRFDKNFTQINPMVDYSLRHSFRKINDSLYEHVNYKKLQVWSITDIGIFLQAFFKMPKKFEEIKKFLPEKNLKEIIQLFYLLKYQFKLKKFLRIQARRKREELIKEHTKKIIEVFRKKFPNQEFISQQDISGILSCVKFSNREVYYEKFGKDTSKIQHALKDFQDYSRYKESAFGGERVTDEGPFNGDDNSRRGSSQWTYEEKMMFIKHFKQYGRNWIEIANVITTKSSSQVRNFFQNYKKKLKLDSISEEQDEITILTAAGITKK